VWRGMGFSMVIFLAGLTNIPDQFYDAAEVDGANGWQTTRMVTIPLLVPILLLVVVVNTIGAFKVFTQMYVMGQKGGTYFGGPMNSTLTIVLKVYESSFVDLRIGLGQALAFVLTIIVLSITAVQRRLFRRFDFEY
jgi:multiple sugar transport system permease protein